MADYLVIVESPAKAKTIERYLGKKYKVRASMGHVIDLPKSQMGVDVENEFEPKYITIRGKGPVLKELKNHSKNLSVVILRGILHTVWIWTHLLHAVWYSTKSQRMQSKNLLNIPAQSTWTWSMHNKPEGFWIDW